MRRDLVRRGETVDVQDIRVTGSLGGSSINRAMQPSVHEDRALIDLRRASFVNPAGLVAIASFAEREARSGRSVHCLSPAESHVANYLARARLGRALDEVGAEHDFPTVRELDVGDNLLPVRVFDSSQGFEDLARHVWAQVMPMNEEAAAAIYVGLVSTGENVGAHSGQARGYMAAQKTHGGRLLRFAVGDAGRGFRASLAHLSPQTDVSALEMAVRPGVTGTGETGRGYGLPELVERLTQLDGSLHLTSGTGRHTVWSSLRSSSATTAQGLQGSVLEGELPLRG